MTPSEGSVLLTPYGKPTKSITSPWITASGIRQKTAKQRTAISGICATLPSSGLAAIVETVASDKTLARNLENQPVNGVHDAADWLARRLDLL